MNARVLMFPLLGLALTAVAGAQDAAKDDLKRFQGTWYIVSQEFEGKKAQEDEIKGMTVTITGDRYALKQGDKVLEKGSQKLDPAKKPKAIDLHIEEGADKGKDQVGIYELADDTLKVCFALPGAVERPKAFETKPGSNIGLIVLKRQKQ
jgi:uncharacterized protein (TIGR03067 family)